MLKFSFIALLGFGFSLPSLAQIEKIQYRLIQCPSEHCISAPVYDGDQIYYIDTSNGSDEFSGNKLFTNNELYPTWYAYYDNNKQISNLQMDQFGIPIAQVGDVIVRLPPSQPIETLTTTNESLPIKTNTFNTNDVSTKVFYLASSSCQSGNDGDQIISAGMITSNNTDDLRHLRMERPVIIADSCQSIPEPFYNAHFIRVSPSEKYIIYNIEVSSIASSRLYYHRLDGSNFAIADSAIAADVNDDGFAVWATINNVNQSVDIFITDLLKGSRQLISQIPIQADTFVMVPEIYIDTSNQVSFLVQTYHFVSQGFSDELYASFSGNSSPSLVLSTGDPINGRVIDSIRWNKHGFKNSNVLAASVRYQDDFEAIIKVFDNSNNQVGFNLDRVTMDSNGQYLLTVNQRAADTRTLKINTSVPVLATTSIPIDYLRTLDNILRTRTATITMARKATYSNSPGFPAIQDNPPSYNIDITMNPSSPEITIKPPSSLTMHIIRDLNNQSDCNDDELGNNCIFACVKQGLNIIVPPNKSGKVNIYESLRNEYLSNTVTGQYYLQMYDSNFNVIRDTMFSEATSAWTFLSLFNTWQPAIESLLNGDGSYQITREMTQVLHETLDIIDRNAAEPFKTQIYDAREKMHLYESTNKTILELMQNEFEPSFVDIIFLNGFV